ncbi:DEAD/DEAH box helicase [Streptomyces sp. HUAS MG91]|uniref:DEAD/DEAH box helicase n=1 Tax=Streptomyces tabacisoli TaxID=3156398 RepID=A0AAU8IMS2_9ACTN
MPDATGEPPHRSVDLADGPPPAGTVIEVRDEEWLVRKSREVRPEEFLIKAVGASELVRGHEAVFLSSLDRPKVLRPEDTELVADPSPGFRRGRLLLEAVLRKTPLAQGERGLAVTDGYLLDRMDYQLRPAAKALANPLRPRLLIGDVVGLGKTLEIGALLGELIRRGRGERIMVVTPAAVLEQFQHEMWTRFSIPLVRLDSAGIARIERKVPAGRNPFTYYQRVIVSIDMLRNRSRYEKWLKDVRWDAVVIDESHNLINKGTDRRRVAELLSRQTDALILASATPHNGDMPAFTGLIRLLDPMAVKDPKKPKAEELRHVMLRRTKASREVKEQLADHWAPRGDSFPVRCAASGLEEQVFAEIAEQWLGGEQAKDGAAALADGTAVRKRGKGSDHLFPYVLLKSFLSSHRALFATVRSRLTEHGTKLPKGQDKIDGPDTGTQGAVGEVASLLRLADLARAIERATLDELDSPAGPSTASKLAGLVAELRRIGVRAGSPTRAVVFSERHETLKWLGRVLPPLLGWKNDKDATAAVRTMFSGSASDAQQQELVDEFARAGTDVRVLLTGDGASEGVNLHRQCHHLLHWDLPWSLIRVEQRNGRIDRYGQVHKPEFRAMLLTTASPGALDDTTVAEKVLAREHKVHSILGAVEAATVENDWELEEKRLMEALFQGEAPEQAVAALETAPEALDSESGWTADRPVEQRLYGEFGTDGPGYGFGESEGDFGGFDGLGEGDFDDFTPQDDYGDLLDELDTPSTSTARHQSEHTGEGSDDAAPPTTDDADTGPIPLHRELRLFPDRSSYVMAGLDELADVEAFRLDTAVDGEDLSFRTPEDLADRLDVLPPGYLREQNITARMKLTFSRENGADALKRARESKGSMSLWPDVHYVGELHPVIEWITDKVLVQFGRRQALVLQVDRERVPEPVFLMQGVWSNAEGRPTAVGWLAVDRLSGDTPRVRHLIRETQDQEQAADPDLVSLAELGIDPDKPMDDHFGPSDPTALQSLVPAAVEATRQAMGSLRVVADARVDAPLRTYETEVEQWRQEELPGMGSSREHRATEADLLRETAERLRTTGDPMIRVLAVLEPSS